MLFMYFLSPFVGYIFGGSFKFIFNIIKHKKINVSFIGMGGMPSTHTSIATAPLTLCIIDNGINNMIVGIGTAFLLVTIIDALDLRKKISQHARLINLHVKDKNNLNQLNENIHHSFIEIIGGVLSGSLAGFFVYYTSIILFKS